MDFDIVGSVREAEAAAADKIARAREESAAIAAAAEKKAAEISATCEADCAKLRADTLKAAQVNAEADYNKTIESNRASAQKYADGVLKFADGIVTEIVGRLTK